MGIFSSEISANRHNSGKFETLIALQNDLRWLLLHSWFSKFPRGRPPRTTLQEEIHGEILVLVQLSNFCAIISSIYAENQTWVNKFLGFCIRRNIFLGKMDIGISGGKNKKYNRRNGILFFFPLFRKLQSAGL